ncbi:UNVERIFIED_CONTAM: hypothetical protein HDU68_006122, partial [Siphonaria sp. JEL0065]
MSVNLSEPSLIDSTQNSINSVPLQNSNELISASNSKNRPPKPKPTFVGSQESESFAAGNNFPSSGPSSRQMTMKRETTTKTNMSNRPIPHKPAAGAVITSGTIPRLNAAGATANAASPMKRAETKTEKSLKLVYFKSKFLIP